MSRPEEEVTITFRTESGWGLPVVVAALNGVEDSSVRVQHFTIDIQSLPSPPVVDAFAQQVAAEFGRKE